MDSHSELRGGPKESFEEMKNKANEKRMEETDRLHRLVRAQGTSVEVVTDDSGHRQPPGSSFRRISYTSDDSAEPQGQVQTSKKKGRNPKGQRFPSGSVEERADPDPAKRISNKIRNGKSGIRSSTLALRKTNLRDAKRKAAHESDEDNEDGKTKKEKEGEVSLGEDEEPPSSED